MKRTIMAVLALLVGVLFVLLLFHIYKPIKMAVHNDQLQNAKNYIIIRLQKSTAFDWLALADENGEFDEYFGVILKGQGLPGFSEAIELAGDNKFVCYGKFGGYEIPEDLDEEVRVFYVESWDILYPIQREAIVPFLLPKSYMCRCDFYDYDKVAMTLCVLK